MLSYGDAFLFCGNLSNGTANVCLVSTSELGKLKFDIISRRDTSVLLRICVES